MKEDGCGGFPVTPDHKQRKSRRISSLFLQYSCPFDGVEGVERLVLITQLPLVQSARARSPACSSSLGDSNINFRTSWFASSKQGAAVVSLLQQEAAPMSCHRKPAGIPFSKAERFDMKNIFQNSGGMYRGPPRYSARMLTFLPLSSSG